jgi:hypothetical protein
MQDHQDQRQQAQEPEGPGQEPAPPWRLTWLWEVNREGTSCCPRMLRLTRKRQQRLFFLIGGCRFMIDIWMSTLEKSVAMIAACASGEEYKRCCGRS